MANGENPQVVRAMLRWTNLNMLAHAWKWIGSPVVRWSCNRAWALNSAVECHLHTVEVVGSNPTAPTTVKLPPEGICPSAQGLRV